LKSRWAAIESGLNAPDAPNEEERMSPQEEQVRIVREVNPSLLGWPAREEASSDDGAFGNREYRDFRGASWSDAKQALAEEDCMARDGLEGLVRRDENAETDDGEPFFGLDAGVASTVMALSAARCIPISSCNGMPGHHESLPVVAFFCRPTRLPDLLAVAEEVQCGFENVSAGAVMVYADDVRTVMEFARRLIARRHSLSKVRVATPKPDPAETRDVLQPRLPRF
jgi:hypothetical protein